MKEERFNEIPLPPEKPNKKKPFGTEERLKAAKTQKVSPASYTIPTIFEIEKYKKKGKSISCFREKPKLSDVPGPGNYEMQNPQGILYSIGLKLQIPRKDTFPAPNHYNQNIQALSKYKNFGMPFIK